MDYDFNISKAAFRIPIESYRPIKRCPYCQSVYINEILCEACGRSMSYHPIGEAFGPKSFYGIKERYLDSQNFLEKLNPVFEDKTSLSAKSYVRNLSKRFSDLISAFNSVDMISTNERKVFYVECVEIINELLRYNVHPSLLQSLIEDNDGSLIGQELLYHLQNERETTTAEIPWQEAFLNYRLWGLIRTDFVLKTFIITTTIIIMAVIYRDIISLQLGK